MWDPVHIFGANFTPLSRGAVCPRAPRVSVGPTCTLSGAKFTPLSRGAGHCRAPRIRNTGGAAILRAPRLSLGALFYFLAATTHHPSFLLFSSSSSPPLNSRSARPLPFPTSFSSLSSHILPHKSTYFLHVYVRKHLPHLVLDLPPPGALSFDVFVGR